jgi:hypothetical protein
MRGGDPRARRRSRSDGRKEASLQGKREREDFFVDRQPFVPWVFVLALAATPGVASHTHAAVLYVDDSASGAGNGTSWSDAYVALQDALAAAVSGSEIWTAAGTYEPDRGAGQILGDRSATFRLLSGVALYGGFGGHEVSRDERDPALHLAILSGDLARDDLPDWVNHAENSYHVVSAAGVDSTAVLDGFTIQGGHAETSGGQNGAAAGIFLQNANPAIESCTVRGNLAHFGAALGLLPGSPRVSDCRFEGNYAWTGRGGAVYTDTGSRPVFARCRFVANTSRGASGVGDGGAMFNSDGSTVGLAECSFVGNTSTANLPTYSNGGAVCNLGDGMWVENCAFYGNTALQAGAVWTARNVSFVNTIFSGNTSLFGGGLVLFSGNASFVNCDFSRNEADDGGGIAVGWNSTATIRNSILWGNIAWNAPSEFKAQIHKSDATATADFRYSVVQGVFTTEPGEDPPDSTNFPGCTESDPLFVDADGPDNRPGTEDDALALQPGSPAVDAAENASVPVGTVLDFAGAPRFHDDPCAVDVGLGEPPIVDMGALEFPVSSCPGGVGTEQEGAADRSLSALVVSPNPFGEACRIAFRLGSPCAVAVEVHDVTGRLVRRLSWTRLDAGVHEATWDGRDERGVRAPEGGYALRLSAGELIRTGKVILRH